MRKLFENVETLGLLLWKAKLSCESSELDPAS